MIFNYGNKTKTGQFEQHPVVEKDYPIVQPIRYSYKHDKCKKITTMSEPIARSFASKPKFYTETFCTNCENYFKVDEFRWLNKDGTETNEIVGGLNYA